MGSRLRKLAHVLERLGLALAGAASGALVAGHVGSSIAAFGSQTFIVVMMIGGALGFYLGIDIPRERSGVSESASDRVTASVEFLSAIGTFLATLASFISVYEIVLHEHIHTFWTIVILMGWALGVMMQISAGAIARMRAHSI